MTLAQPFIPLTLILLPNRLAIHLELLIKKGLLSQAGPQSHKR
jgi:hypothetical protein